MNSHSVTKMTNQKGCSLTGAEDVSYLTVTAAVVSLIISGFLLYLFSTVIKNDSQQHANYSFWKQKRNIATEAKLRVTCSQTLKDCCQLLYNCK